MIHRPIIALVFTALVPVAFAQKTDGAPAAPAAPAPAAPQDAAKAAPGEPVRYALVEADGGKRNRMTAAISDLGGSTATKAKFLATRKLIAKAAASTSRPTSRPESRAATPATGPESRAAGEPSAVPKTVVFNDKIKGLMNAAVSDDQAAAAAAFGALVADAEFGAAALAQLNLRSETLVSRMMSGFMRKQMETNAIFEGQYADLKEYGVDGLRLLCAWTADPPKDVAEGQTENFKSAAVRAVRDFDPPAEHRQAVLSILKNSAGRAAQAGNQDLLFTAAGVLRRLGDAAIFDTLKEQAGKAAANADPMTSMGGAKALADLHYAAGEHAASGDYFKQAVVAGEKAKVPPASLAINYYNAACNFALSKKIDDAFEMLGKAAEAGAKAGAVTEGLFRHDRDIAVLRDDPRFAKLMETYFPKKS